MDVKLVMFKQDGQRREFSLKTEATTIGRNTDCDFQIPLGVISRRHCQISLDQGHIIIRDLGSSNGTFVNGKRVQESALGPGDTLMIGPVIFTVVVDGNPADVKPVRTVVDGGAVHMGNAPELEEGTVDVEAEMHLDELETVEDEPEAQANSADPLAALSAMSKKKK